MNLLRIALLDVDGTTHHLADWAPGARELLKSLSDAGIIVALASGRAITNLTILADDIPEVTYLAASSGSLVVRRGENGWDHLGSRLLTQKLVEETWAEALRLELPIWGYTDDAWLVPKYYPILDEEIEILGGEQPTFAPIVGRNDINKLLVAPQTAKHEAFLAEISQDDALAVVSSYPGRFDIIDGASARTKGGDVILADVGLGWDETMAVGDGGNDIGMLSKARVAFLMSGLSLTELDPAQPGQLRIKTSIDAIWDYLNTEGLL